MTASCSFLKVLKEDAKRRIWLYILSAYLYLTHLIDYMLAQSGHALLMGDQRLGPGNNTVFLITGNRYKGWGENKGTGGSYGTVGI